jgi:mevalonate kinase
MPKEYVLKNVITSPAKIQRLLKKISVNADTDRDRANKLLDKVEEALKQFLANSTENEEGANGEFHKLIQSAVLALNQAGIANERLLKLATLLQKFETDGGKGKSKDSGQMGGSLFANLNKLANSPDEDDEE